MPSDEETRAALLEGQEVDPDNEPDENPADDPSQSPPEPAETTDLPEPDEGAPDSEGEGAPPAAFLEQLSELGFENVETEEDGRARLLESYQQYRGEMDELRQQLKTLQPMAEYGQQYLEELRANKRQTQAPQAEAETDKPWWNPPKFEMGWLERYRETDPESGAPRWKENTPADVRTSVEAYQAYLEDWADGLTRRPDELLPPIIEAIARPLFERLYEERHTAESDDQFVNELRSQNDWLFEKDPRTNQITNRLSREGQLVSHFIDEAARLGIADARQQWEYGKRMYRLAVLEDEAQSNGKTTTARQTAATKRRQHQRRSSVAENPAERGGSTQTESLPQNTNLSPGQRLLEQMELDGVGTT